MDLSAFEGFDLWFKKGVSKCIKCIILDIFTLTFYGTFNTKLLSVYIMRYLFFTKNRSQVETSGAIPLLLSFHLERVDCFILKGYINLCRGLSLLK